MLPDENFSNSKYISARSRNFKEIQKKICNLKKTSHLQRLYLILKIQLFTSEIN